MTMLKAFEMSAFLTDAQWLELARNTPLGGYIDTSQIEIMASLRLYSLGFGSLGPQRYVHVAPLEATTPLVPTCDAELDAIDAIAIISVDRGLNETPYLYNTLRNVLTHFPQGVQINVMVGDDNADYVAPAKLKEVLGDAWAQRVHVHVPHASVAAFLRDHADVRVRMTWNYARTLRSYLGARHLLLMEDDVQWAYRAAKALNDGLSEAPEAILSAYNRACNLLPGVNLDNLWTPSFVRFPLRCVDLAFACTQAMVFHAPVVGPMGDFIGVRLGKAPVDMLIDLFARLHDLPVTYAQPSMVQHMGKQTTGLGKFHKSQCFSPIYPDSPQA
jgi:hypothetical protein